MSIANYFPIWDKLDQEDQERLERVSVKRTVEKGTSIHRAATDCIGLLLVESGQLRAYMASDEGKEITLYRLFEQDICLFSASCFKHIIKAHSCRFHYIIIQNYLVFKCFKCF